MQDYRELKVWQKAHELTLAIYRATASFPGEERFGLTSQLRRCAASVPANLAEGRCRPTDREFARFVVIALGSASETSYHLLLAHDLGFLSDDTYAGILPLAEEVRKMLIALHTRLMGSASSER